ncbi:hypothetical protein HGA88_00065 [Candidatus Roizmanbacteria bacterium]|nr:hypothetical protein [Candidatus Roizmanbacteria bacterium]
MEDTNKISSLRITFDKSHLSSIGERMYSQSLDLIRELVANAYDADSSRVEISVGSQSLTVRDNGSGMDRAGLEQYFTIGSAYKKSNPVSSKYKRARIGEFGIGKFAVLSLCDRFELYTSSSDYAATVIFDRQDFEHQQDWTVPIIEHTPTGKQGTYVTLYNVKKDISLLDLERYLTNLFPLTDPHFSIVLNERKLEPKYIAGERIRIQEYTKFGTIKGEIILASLMLSKESIGIGIRVKGVLIKRSLFGVDANDSLSFRKVTGEVNADFLLMKTDRSDFITDREEYELFEKIMIKKLKRAVLKMEKRQVSYQDKKSEKVLSDVLLMIRGALRRNNTMFISGDLPLFARHKTKNLIASEITDGIIGTELSQKKSLPKTEDEELKKLVKEAVKKLKPKLRGRVKTLMKDEQRIIKKIKIGGTELLVSFAHLGEEEKESFVDGGIIFINRDHALYKQIETKTDLMFYHLIRLVSQELIKFAYPKNIEVAFDWQGKLMKDCYQGREE